MNSITVEQNVPARMRDGVTLYADVYRPAEPGRFPVLLTRLPYGKEALISTMFPMMHLWRAVRAGYAVIVQDCRGTFSSEGDFDFRFCEGEDGYDTVQWAATLPYSTAAVGMFGVSYLGWTQWSTAALRPPHLRAIAPMQTVTDWANSHFRGGAFELGAGLGWRATMGMAKLTRQMTAAGRPPTEVGATLRTMIAFMDALTEGGYAEVPLRLLKSLEAVGLGNIIGNFVDVGPAYRWDGCAIEHSDVDVPSLNIAGWYDVFQQDTIDNFVGARTQGRGLAQHSHLLVGPWSHGQVATMPGMMVGEENFGLAASGAMVDLTGIHLRWFDHWLKGVDNGVEKEPPVRLFLTGDNNWIDSSDWPPPDVKGQPIYLAANRALAYSPPAAYGGSTSFTYNPAEPAPTLGGNTLIALPGVRDQRPLTARPDVLTFSAEPVKSPVRVVGRVTANLWVSSSAPDTDFVVRLIDVHPDGYMQNLCDGIVRARYRNSLKEVSWLQPGEVYELKVDLWSIAHVFKPGHQVAVQVTSSSFPRWDRNWNTTENPGAATGGQHARQTIWHHASHPSCVILPVLAG